MTRPGGSTLIGRWRITEADLWDHAHLDLVEPARITIGEDGHGAIVFGALSAGLDCEYAQSIVFFTWHGFDDMHEVWGDGSVELDDDGTVEIEFRYHLGDEAILKARRW